MARKTQRLTALGLCAALGLTLSYLEALLPPLYPTIPGIKLGLANLVILFVLYRFDFGSAALVSAVRLGAMTLLFGSVPALIYSAAGSALSLILMGILKRTNWFSPVGVSVLGGVSHNAGQILAAMGMLQTGVVVAYLPVLTITGTLAGALVGLLGAALLKKTEGLPLDIKKERGDRS